MAMQRETQRFEFPKELAHPVEASVVLRKREALRRKLLTQPDLRPSRIAILGGSTTQEVRSILELFLLAQSIQPVFYESNYNAYFEEVMFDNPSLREFKPEIVYVHTSWVNVSRYPKLLSSAADADELVKEEMARYTAFWDKIHDTYDAVIIQNNFDLPLLRPVGNLDASEAFGRTNFLMRLNQEFARYAQTHSRFHISDLHYISAQVGLTNWFDYTYWYNYHMAMSPAGTVAVGQNVARIVKSIYGKTKKCLVLDLDNTLWGGVIGDDGLQNLVLGRDHPVGEAYLGFQRYVKELRDRGILLAVCSKNDFNNAKEGFSHPDSVLRMEDFSAFKANWDPKHENIRAIALELNIGLDSLVFVDDNPAERAIVTAQLPEVAVPDVGSDVSCFAGVLEGEGYFETTKLVKDDLDRATFYTGNVQRACYEATFRTYDDFLASLEMEAEIAQFAAVYMERITQLINKTNQFNLTTRRYTAAEVEAMAADRSQYVTLYGRLKDKFGDNGLVSVLIGRHRDGVIEVDVWLMSCRVLKRSMEHAMFDALVEECRARGVTRIIGVYIPSKKNGMVAEHYAALGFTRVADSPAEQALWSFDIQQQYVPKNQHIRVISERAALKAVSA